MNEPISQRDPRWRFNKLGDSPFTIGKIGCTITSIAWLNGTTPDVYAKQFKFTPDGLVYWSSVPDFKYRFYHRTGINYKLNGGRKIILEVDHSHWVAVADFDNLNQEYLIMDPWAGKFITFKSLENPGPYGEVTGYADIGINKFEQPDWLTTKPMEEEKPTYPVSIPDMVKLPTPKPEHQGSTNACTVFATVFAMGSMGQPPHKSTLDIYKGILATKYDNYDPRKSVSYKELFKYLKLRYRKLPVGVANWKLALYEGRPILATINDQITHAICVFGYNEDGFAYYDSRMPKKPFKTLRSLESVAESYVLFV